MNRTLSRNYDRLSCLTTPPSCRPVSPHVDTLGDDRYAKTHLDSVSENGTGSAVGTDHNTHTCKRKRSRISVINHPLQHQHCACPDVRREIDDLKSQMHRIESSLKDDTKVILELLKNNMNNKNFFDGNSEPKESPANSQCNSLSNSRPSSEIKLKNGVPHIGPLTYIEHQDSHV